MTTVVRGSSRTRTFLFLQGPSSPFFFKLSRALLAQGAAVRKIQICGGDLAFWPAFATLFRRPFAAWPNYVSRYLRDEHVTDIVLFGDCRPYHVAAIAAARELGLALHLFEEGYLRPNWITLEHEGVNDRSDLPRVADAIRIAAAAANEPVGKPVIDQFFHRAAWDVLTSAATVSLGPLFPNFQRHTLTHPIVEYFGWARRWARRKAIARRNATAAARIAASHGPRFILPLQLDGDFQLRVHSDFTSSLEAADGVIASFSRHAPPAALLVLKRHPFDVGPGDTRAFVLASAMRHGISDRCVFLEDGDIAPLIAGAAGVVVVNSTSALMALAAGTPLAVLGRANYAIPGLVHPGSLDAFWAAPTPPDPSLWAEFRHLLVAKTQVNGGFFSMRGIDRAVEGCVPRMFEIESAVFLRREQ